MFFSEYLSMYKNYPVDRYLTTTDSAKIKRCIDKDTISIEDFLLLLSDTAEEYLEPMARKAAFITRQNFGNVISIFTPLYISNYCQNNCRYCSFSKDHSIYRKQLDYELIHKEAEVISKSGIRHILVLTGEAPDITTYDYIKQSLKIISRYFSAISIEMYPFQEIQYKELIQKGYIDSLTIYQETYNKKLYQTLHTTGPKSDFQYRLNTPDRACRQNIRAITIGALLGLDTFKREAFYLAHHTQYIQQKYPGVELSISFPRIRPLAGDYTPANSVSDKQLVQLITAMRLLFPSVGMTLSTRESSHFRDNILPLGITKASAGVSTAVGGHTLTNPSTTQFEISDSRTVSEMKKNLLSIGFQPVMHDWNMQINCK